MTTQTLPEDGWLPLIPYIMYRNYVISDYKNSHEKVSRPSIDERSL